MKERLEKLDIVRVCVYVRHDKFVDTSMASLTIWQLYIDVHMYMALP